MISRRAYKAKWSESDVCGYIKDRAGTQFDTDIASVLLSHSDEVLALYK